MYFFWQDYFPSVLQCSGCILGYQTLLFTSVENLGVGIPPKFLSKTLGKRDVAVTHAWICREVGVLAFQVVLLGLSAVLLSFLGRNTPGTAIKQCWPQRASQEKKRKVCECQVLASLLSRGFLASLP